MHVISKINSALKTISMIIGNFSTVKNSAIRGDFYEETGILLIPQQIINSPK